MQEAVVVAQEPTAPVGHVEAAPHPGQTAIAIDGVGLVPATTTFGVERMPRMSARAARTVSPDATRSANRVLRVKTWFLV